ncbi:response regulator transcription factor [Pelagibius litoralis]|uniref:Response regulator transcription factor n=1 Tax=Pelagibius litoralis TaxID=374515 RepID=A0A967F3Q1_9PROT|nr:response regulator transcription factor [Pelagibius litoralis]NIA72427.1 response regulator transcription factor [Pelagibius litoralis]
MNVLLVEDEARVADFVLRGLRAEGWMVIHAPDAETALELTLQERFDVVLLDLMLPGLPGQDFCRKLRARRDYTPILILSALDALDERVEGLRIGADDYMVKPFEFDELIARVEALARRSGRFTAAEPETVLRAGAIALDLESLEATVDGEVLDLTAKEREILKLFLSKPGRVFSRERILNSVWGASEDPLTNIVDVYVGRLRRKLNGHGDQLQTVRGAGYRLSPK